MNDIEIHREIDTMKNVLAGLQRGIDEILELMRSAHSSYSRTFCHLCGHKLECANQEHNCKPMEV